MCIFQALQDFLERSPGMDFKQLFHAFLLHLFTFTHLVENFVDKHNILCKNAIRVLS